MGDLLKISMLKGSLVIIFLLLFSVSVSAQEITRMAEAADIEVSFSNELLIEKGWSKYININIENSGKVKLEDVKIRIDGENSGWFEFQSSDIGSIRIGEQAEVVGKVFVPYETSSGNIGN